MNGTCHERWHTDSRSKSIIHTYKHVFQTTDTNHSFTTHIQTKRIYHTYIHTSTYSKHQHWMTHFMPTKQRDSHSKWRFFSSNQKHASSLRLAPHAIWSTFSNSQYRSLLCQNIGLCCVNISLFCVHICFFCATSLRLAPHAIFFNSHKGHFCSLFIFSYMYIYIYAYLNIDASG